MSIQRKGGFRPTVIEGGLSVERDSNDKKGITKAHDYKLEVRVNSEINEERIFKIEEILEQIKEVTSMEDLNSNCLEIIKEVKDKEGNLILLSVGIKTGKLNNLQRNEKWGSVVYDYMIKGTHGNDFSDTTCITKSYMNVDGNGIIEMPNEGMVAEYLPSEGQEEGKWRYYIEQNEK